VSAPAPGRRASPYADPTTAFDVPPTPSPWRGLWPYALAWLVASAYVAWTGTHPDTYREYKLGLVDSYPIARVGFLVAVMAVEAALLGVIYRLGAVRRDAWREFAAAAIAPVFPIATVFVTAHASPADIAWFWIAAVVTLATWLRLAQFLAAGAWRRVRGRAG
jgi:hypothetical protein